MVPGSGSLIGQAPARIRVHQTLCRQAGWLLLLVGNQRPRGSRTLERCRGREKRREGIVQPADGEEARTCVVPPSRAPRGLATPGTAQAPAARARCQLAHTHRQLSPPARTRTARQPGHRCAAGGRRTRPNLLGPRTGALGSPPTERLQSEKGNESRDRGKLSAQRASRERERGREREEGAPGREAGSAFPAPRPPRPPPPYSPLPARPKPGPEVRGAHHPSPWATQTRRQRASRTGRRWHRDGRERADCP